MIWSTVALTCLSLLLLGVVLFQWYKIIIPLRKNLGYMIEYRKLIADNPEGTSALLEKAEKNLHNALKEYALPQDEQFRTYH